MQEVIQEGEAFGAERRRSRSEDPNAGGAAGAINAAAPAVSTPSAEEPIDFESEAEALAEEQAAEPEQELVGEDIPAEEDLTADQVSDPAGEEQDSRIRFCCPRRGQVSGRKALKKKTDPRHAALNPTQRLLILDTWKRSGLPALDFASIIGVSKHTLYGWKQAFDELGPAGLMDKPRGGRQANKLHDLTKRTILMLKEKNPDWGCQRISDMLLRGPALPASPATVAKVLHEAGYENKDEPTQPHPDKVRSFERARPNQMWQSDLFTFVLKRQNRRVHLVAFMDDHSRFIVSYGLHASQSTALVLEVLRAGIASYGAPGEILTDNGSQYITWRGKSAFSRELEKRGIQHVVATPRRPQTLGKVERFWGTLWRELLEVETFIDLGDARSRIGLFIDHYNFQRPHQGIDGLVPADRFFGAAPEVLRTLKARVGANALDLARHGIPKKPFYMTGQVDGKSFSVHAEGERVILTKESGQREEIDLAPSTPQKAAVPAQAAELPKPVCPQGQVTSAPNELGMEEPQAPGTTVLDEGLRKVAAAADQKGGER
jgi:transposase InsO family protein